MDNLREDLDHLVHSPGWLRFCQHVEQEWGTREKGGGLRYERAAEQAANLSDDALALGQLRQIITARREIHSLIAWVDETLKQTKKDDRELQVAGPPDYSRRGGL